MTKLQVFQVFQVGWEPCNMITIKALKVTYWMFGEWLLGRRCPVVVAVVSVSAGTPTRPEVILESGIIVLQSLTRSLLGLTALGPPGNPATQKNRNQLILFAKILKTFY